MVIWSSRCRSQTPLHMSWRRSHLPSLGSLPSLPSTHLQYLPSSPFHDVSQQPSLHHLTPNTYHLTPITHHLSPITYHLSFRYALSLINPGQGKASLAKSAALDAAEAHQAAEGAHFRIKATAASPLTTLYVIWFIVKEAIYMPPNPALTEGGSMRSI